MQAAVVALAVAVAVASVFAALTYRNRWSAATTSAREVELRSASVLEEVSGVADRLSSALDALAEGVVVVDEEGREVMRNATAAAYRDPRHGDAIVARAMEELIAAASEGDPGVRTLELYGPPERVVVVRAMPLSGEDGPSGVLATVEDVTERRRLEAVRRDFVANMSHELRTPVGAIRLLAETLAGEDDPEVASRLAERVLTEADRVTRTIEDLVALTRIENEDDAVREPVPVVALLTEAEARIAPVAAQRGVPVVVGEVDPGAVVQADRRQLSSALHNLVDNAVAYSDPGSPVRIEAEVDVDEVRFTVSDEGVGIPAKDLDRVFERFYRVDSARGRHTGGTGLGLAIVRHVARNHHGTVTVASRQGEGSTFTLAIPARAQG